MQQLVVVKFRSKPVGRALNPGRQKAKSNVCKCRSSALKQLAVANRFQKNKYYVPNSVKKFKTKKYRKLKHTIEKVKVI